MNRIRLNQALSSMGLAGIITAYIFLLLPFTIYIGNVNEFTISFDVIVHAYVPAAIFIIGVFFLVGLVFPVSLYSRYTALLAMLGILLWIQGNLLVWDYGLLDGREIEWMSDDWRGWLDMGIWIAGLLFAFFYGRTFGRKIITAAILLFGLQLLLLMANWMTYSSVLKKPESTHVTKSTEKFFEFAAQKNVVHILADGFQSDIFEELIMEDRQGSDIAATMEGFTFYRDNLAAFPYTHMAIPAILSSKIYRNKVPIDEFLQYAMGEKSILNAVYDAGYDVDMVVPEGLLFMYKKGRYTNLSTVPAQMHISDAEYEVRDVAKLLDLSLFRLSPHFLKERIYNDQLWLIQSLLNEKKYMGIKYFSDKGFLNKLQQNILIKRKKPVYKYLHLMLSHQPMVSNEQCEYAGRVLPTVRETVKNQARCSLAEIIKLFQEMKKAGIYDDALIILMADHGAWVPPEKMTGITASDGKSITVMNPKIIALSQPLLAIKPPGEKGALQISNAPSWIVDTAPTIADYMEIDTDFDGRSVRDLGENEARERRHLVYEYQRSDWKDKYLSPIQEFTVTGKGIDSSSWHEEAIHLPGGVERKNQRKSSLWQKVPIRQ